MYCLEFTEIAMETTFTVASHISFDLSFPSSSPCPSHHPPAPPIIIPLYQHLSNAGSSTLVVVAIHVCVSANRWIVVSLGVCESAC